MDKTSRALIGVEDNAEDIRALKARLNDDLAALGNRMESAETALKNNSIMFVAGQVTEENGQKFTTFGKFVMNGPAIVIMSSNDAARRALYLDRDMIANGVTTIMQQSGEGCGEFWISPYSDTARLLIIGDVTKIE